jgi:hypothetical protein
VRERDIIVPPLLIYNQMVNQRICAARNNKLIIILFKKLIFLCFNIFEYIYKFTVVVSVVL